MVYDHVRAPRRGNIGFGLVVSVGFGATLNWGTDDRRTWGNKVQSQSPVIHNLEPF